MVENKNQVRFGLWLPKVGNWPLSGSVKETNLTNLSAFLGAAEHHGDVVRFSIFQNNRKKNDRQPDYNVVVSLASDVKRPASPEQEPITDKNGDDDLPF